MKTLLIVDIQNDFLPGGALAVPHGDEIIDTLNDLQEKFDLILASKDWHPEGHISFASTHGRKVGELLEIEGRLQELWPDHCIQNSWGAEFSKQLNTKRIEKVFYKGAFKDSDSYSAFFDNNKARSTGLYEYLQGRKISQLAIAGLATDYCVKFTALDGLECGLKMTVVIDACRGIELKKGDIKRACEAMERRGALLIPSGELS